VVCPARLFATSLLGASPILFAVLSAVALLWIFLRIWLAVVRMVSMNSRADQKLADHRPRRLFRNGKECERHRVSAQGEVNGQSKD
jgi:hypothetical protein